MKLNRAIYNLTEGREDCGMIPPDEYTLTIDMAIAALARVRYQRGQSVFPYDTLLPGETEN